MSQHTGNVIKLGDHIDTDIIIPTQYMALETIQDMLNEAVSRIGENIAIRRFVRYQLGETAEDEQ